MTVSSLDPVADRRWDSLVERVPCASVFHSRGWLEALQRTYGYEPFVLTTTEHDGLENGLVLCRVRTWMSHRLISLPFSDHCEPLVDDPNDLAVMVRSLVREVSEDSCRSIEFRPRSDARLWREVPITPARRYWLHTLDLSRSLHEIFDDFHRSSTQRAIRRAEREGLSYETGTSERLVSVFYALLRLTRRRHGLPPQPLAWFHNLVALLGDRLAIHVASKDGRPIASILTLSFKKTMFYKYGGSDAKQHHLGGMPFLFWRMIEGAKERGMEELDLGRSDLDQPGLVAFKEHLGATRSMLTYYTYPQARHSAARDRSRRAARIVIAHLPRAALDLTGRLFYKHLA